MAALNQTFDAKLALEESLALISDDEKASFSAKGTIEEVNPGLWVEKIGNVGIPISSHDAKRIISVSRQAPFGKGSDTIVDTSVRKTWEIDASQLKLTHPNWSQHFRKIIDDTAKQLGIARFSDVDAKLYKLLVYEPGAMFKAHTDTEKADCMFGTLAICLPCKHEGGDVVVSFNGNKDILCTAAASEWSVTYLAWYADVLHEVRPVISGHRVVLTFNLVQTGPVIRRSPTDHDGLDANLKSTMLQWSQSDACSYLIYLLDHKYTEASLSLDRLKGIDSVRVHRVAVLAENYNFRCYLASVEKVVFGGAEEFSRFGDPHEIFDVCESTLELKRMVDLDGKVVETDVPVDEEDFVQDMPFDREPDEEDYQGYTGNEGAETTHWYRSTAMILLPQKCNIDLRMNRWKPQKRLSDSGFDHNQVGGDAMRHFITDIKDAYKRNPNDEFRKFDLKRICEVVMGENLREQEAIKSRVRRYDWIEDFLPYSDDNVGLVACICLLLDRVDLAERAIRAAQTHIPQQRVSELATYFAKYNFEALRGCLDALAATLPDPAGRLDVCTIVASAFEAHSSEDREKALIWSRFQEDDLVSAKRQVTRADAARLVAAACKRDSATWLLEKVVPFVRLHREDAAFTFAFVNELSNAVGRGMLQENSRNNAIKAICADIVDAFELPDPLPNDLRLPGRVTMMDAKNAQNLWLNPENITAVHRLCIELELDNEHRMLLKRVQDASEKTALDCFDSILLPYLGSLVPMLKSQGVDLKEYGHLFVSCITNYILRCVKQEPAEPSDWTQGPLGCSDGQCAHCRRLDGFLSSPTETSIQFKAVQDRRTHIECRLPKSFDCFKPCDLSRTTERQGVPHTLVITKTRASYKNDHREWSLRAKQAKDKITKLLSPDDLKTVLGDSYEDTINLKAVSLARRAAGSIENSAQLPGQRLQLASLPNPPGHQISTQPATESFLKRRADPSGPQDEPAGKRAKTTEVIDLCDSP